MARVVLENLSKTFAGPNREAIRAARGISLAVADKEFLVLVGPSGSGKSTLLRLIAGLEEPTAGTISIAGAVVNEAPAKDRDVAMVFQNYACYPHLTVRENLSLGLKLRKVAKAEIESRVREASEMLSLSDCLDRLPKTLSGGQRQRVAVGRALVRRPKVFLFDEPLSNLDPPLRLQLRAEISKLRARVGSTMIYVTHDPLEAMSLGDRIAVLGQGTLQQVAEPMDLYQHPANLFVARLIGSPPMNFVRGRLVQRSGRLYFQDEPEPGAAAPGVSWLVSGDKAGPLAPWTDQAVVLGIRPEEIGCDADDFPERSSSCRADGRVELVERMGAETHVHVRIRKHVLVIRANAGAGVKAGERVAIEFDMGRARFFDAATEQAIV